MEVHPFILDTIFQAKVLPHNTEQTNKSLTVFEVTVEGVRKEAMISVCHLCSVAALKCANHVWPEQANLLSHCLTGKICSENIKFRVVFSEEKNFSMSFAAERALLFHHFLFSVGKFIL